MYQDPYATIRTLARLADEWADSWEKLSPEVAARWRRAAAEARSHLPAEEQEAERV
jgi:hypothetical protein